MGCVCQSTTSKFNFDSASINILLIRPPCLKIKTHLLKLTSILIIPQLRMDVDLRILILVVDHEVVVVVNVAGDDLLISSVKFVFALVT